MQRRRPEVSAALAAVLERATAKDLRDPLPRRWTDFVRDLEEVLTYESARVGRRDRARRRRS